jgi:hypothetical protein
MNIHATKLATKGTLVMAVMIHKDVSNPMNSVTPADIAPRHKSTFPVLQNTMTTMATITRSGSCLRFFETFVLQNIRRFRRLPASIFGDC